MRPRVRLTRVSLKRSSQAESLAALGHQACGRYLGDVSDTAAMSNAAGSWQSRPPPRPVIRQAAYLMRRVTQRRRPGLPAARPAWIAPPHMDPDPIPTQLCMPAGRSTELAPNRTELRRSGHACMRMKLCPSLPHVLDCALHAPVCSVAGGTCGDFLDADSAIPGRGSQQSGTFSCFCTHQPRTRRASAMSPFAPHRGLLDKLGIVAGCGLNFSDAEAKV